MQSDTPPTVSPTTMSSERSWLVGRTEAARLCAVSPATWDRLTAAGKVPRPIKLGGRVVWRRSDLESWVSLGCPDRKRFELLTSDLD